MTPQETALVTTLLERLKTTRGQPKDPEAELLVSRMATEKADAAYYLAQTVLIQDLSLHTAQLRIAELEKTVAKAGTEPAPPPSFLGGLLVANQPANPALPAAPSPPPEAAPPAVSGVQAGNRCYRYPLPDRSAEWVREIFCARQRRLQPASPGAR